MKLNDVILKINLNWFGIYIYIYIYIYLNNHKLTASS